MSKLKTGNISHLLYLYQNCICKIITGHLEIMITLNPWCYSKSTSQVIDSKYCALSALSEISGPHSQEKEREILRRGRACEDKNKIRNVKNNAQYEAKEARKWTTNMRHIYQESFPTSSLMME